MDFVTGCALTSAPGGFGTTGCVEVEAGAANLHESPPLRRSEFVASSYRFPSWTPRLRLHGVSSYGRSRRPKPCGRDDFPLGASRQFRAQQDRRSLRVLRSASASRPFGASVMASPFAAIRTAIATGAAAPTMESSDEDIRGIVDSGAKRNGVMKSGFGRLCRVL